MSDEDIPRVLISRRDYQRMTGFTPTEDQVGAVLYGNGGPVLRYEFIEEPEQDVWTDGDRKDIAELERIWNLNANL